MNDDGYEKFSGILAKYISQIRNEQYKPPKARIDGQSLSDLWSDFPNIDVFSGY